MYNRLYEAMSPKDKQAFKEFYSYYWADTSVNGYKGVEAFTGDKLGINQKIDAMVNTKEDAEHFLDSLSDYALA